MLLTKSLNFRFCCESIKDLSATLLLDKILYGLKLAPAIDPTKKLM